jgi:hypothetical protein
VPRTTARRDRNRLGVSGSAFSGSGDLWLIGEAVDRLLTDGAIDPGVEIEGDQLAGFVARKTHGSSDSRRACESMKDFFGGLTQPHKA